MLQENTFPLLETDRLILRRVTSDDANSMLTYLSDADVMKYMGLEPFRSIEEALDEISWYESIFENGTGIRWGISLKGQGEIVGSCGFLNRVAKHSRAEIGFELHKEYWGKGIASEAIASVVSYGFEQMNLQRIEALIELENTSSQKAVERQGFMREGLLRSYEYTCGKFDDLYMYSIVKPDYVRMNP